MKDPNLVHVQKRFILFSFLRISQLAGLSVSVNVLETPNNKRKNTRQPPPAPLPSWFQKCAST